MRWIYISTHLDDCVLSAGGLIHDQTHAGQHVEVWTVVCGYPPDAEPSPLAQVLHFQWGFSSAEETVRKRRLEDEHAVATVGAWLIHFDGFYDCIYRRDEGGQPLYPMDVFAEPHPAEPDLPAKMTAALAERLRPEDVVVCPLAIGGHVDHRIVRKAVEGLGRPLWYYVDVPYVLTHPEELEPATRSMRPEPHKISDQGIAAWVKGIAEYASQISTVFDPPDKMKETMEKYGQSGVCLYRFE
jgi:LmbE family N-acetylglucosaminyl deacetylase